MDPQEMIKQLREKLRSVDTGGDTYWKPTEGDTRIRILPPVHDMGYFFQEAGRHFQMPPDNKIIFCSEFSTAGEIPCVVCDMCRTMQNSGNEADAKLASDMWLRKQYWMNIIVRDINDKTGSTGSGPFIFQPGPKIFGFIKNIMLNPEYGNITDVEKGADVVITKTGSGMQTDYFVAPARDVTPLHTDDDTAIKFIEDAKDLSPVVVKNQEEAAALRGKYVVLYTPEMLSEMYGLNNPAPTAPVEQAFPVQAPPVTPTASTDIAGYSATPASVVPTADQIAAEVAADELQETTQLQETSEVATDLKARIAARRKRSRG